MPVESFIVGAFTTALAEDEIIKSIDVPKLSPSGRCGYYKFSRKIGDFAEASAASVFDPQTETARLFLGALQSMPSALPALASKVAAEGQDAATHDAVLAAIAAALPDLDAIERRMACATVLRVIRQTLQV